MRPSPDDPLVNVPSPEDAILINLAHACYENKLLRLNDLVRVRHALRTAGPSLDWDYMERVAASRGWRDGLAFMVLTYAMLESALFSTRLLPEARCAHFARLAAADRPVQLHLELLHRGQSETLPLDLGYWFCKRLYYRKILADPQRTVSQRWRDAVITVPWGVKLKSRLRPQPGLLVSLSGPDGTGKTAHGTALVDALRLSSVTTNYVWARGGSTGLAALVSRVRRAGRVERPDPECADVETDAQSPGPDAVARRRVLLARRPLLRFAWSWMVAVDQVAAYTLRAKIPAILGRVVVADRYVYDTAVEMDASLPADASWSRRAIETMLRLAPRPDLAYVFDVTPETARERKPDEPWHSSYNDERVAYRRLAERFRMRQLSNDGSFAQANDRLIHEVLQAFMADFETPLNAVFFANPSQHNPTDPCWMRGGPS